MFGILKGLTKAAVTVVSTPVAIVADVVTAGGTLTGRDKLYTEEVMEKMGEAFDEMEDEDEF